MSVATHSFPKHRFSWGIRECAFLQAGEAPAGQAECSTETPVLAVSDDRGGDPDGQPGAELEGVEWIRSVEAA